MQNAPTRERLRFADLSYRPGPDGSRRVTVELEWKDVLYRGEAVGTGTEEGDLRACGEATVSAARAATAGRMSATLLGIKAVRAFDGRVVIAAVEVRGEGSALKLLGAHALAESDLGRGGVRTVLSSINRVIRPFLEEGSAPEVDD